jgi:hypothetical protein
VRALSADLSKGREAQDVLFAPLPSAAAAAAAGAQAPAPQPGPPPFTYLASVVDGDDPSCRVTGQGPRQLKTCCSCKGACVDAETCACLRQASCWRRWFAYAHAYTIPIHTHTHTYMCVASPSPLPFPLLTPFLLNHPTQPPPIMQMGGHAYDYYERLLGRPPKVVLECNINCRCHQRDCPNRVTGRGIQRRLEVFALPLPGAKPPGERKASEAMGLGLGMGMGLGGSVDGYGVRVLEAVAKGSFLCEFTGQVRAR